MGWGGEGLEGSPLLLFWSLRLQNVELPTGCLFTHMCSFVDVSKRAARFGAKSRNMACKSRRHQNGGPICSEVVACADG